MKKLLAIFTCASLQVVAASPADAVVLRFTATSASSGQLGYLDYDSSVFNGASFQLVSNSNLLNIYFKDPISSLVVNSAGPAGDGALFDSSGALPIVIGGSGLTGGDSDNTGVYIALDYFVRIANSRFTDVQWSTAAAPAAVPEPATWALMLAGFGVMGFALRRRQKVTTRYAFS